MASEILRRCYSPIIAVDFDCTLFDTRHIWKIEDMPPVIEGAVHGMRELHLRGYTLVIWTCRDEPEAIAELLRYHGIPFHAINREVTSWPSTRKIVADVYVDDKNLGGLPPWPEIVEWIITNYPV